MDQLLVSIRAPVSGAQARRWVSGQVDLLREKARADGIDVGPLWPAWRAQAEDWLVEIDPGVRDVPLDEDIALASLLLDMQVLGLRPELLSTESAPAPGLSLQPHT